MENFDFGNGGQNNNPILGESYNFGDLNERFGSSFDKKISCNDSGIFKIFKPPTQN